MSAATNFLENAVLALLFNDTALTLGGDLHVALFTGAPGEAGGGTEANYTGYARVAVARSGAGWTVSGNTPTQAANAASITFGACTAGSNTVTHFGLYDAASGGNLLIYGTLTASLAVSAGITPLFAAGQLVVELA